MHIYRSIGGVLGAAALLSLAACGGSSPEGTAQSNLPGQVGAAAPATAVSHYAASRFLEQASMGPNPESVARVRSIGISAWIDEQLKKPVSKITTPTELINHNQNDDRATADRAWQFHRNSIQDLAVSADDQLRYRTAWVLSNVLVVSTRKISNFGGNEYWNMLMANAFSNYGDVIKAVTTHPAMGNFLDNSQNRKGFLNENYGRELMQLFSVGLVQLNLDGTPKRDSAGRPLETYGQRDVIEMSRALTGWDFSPNPANEKVRNNANWASFEKPMIPNAGSHDGDAKVVLGTTIPAGGDSVRDLDAVARLLVSHPNTAPFISLRLIQGLTTSDPSPAYLRRVATVFQQTNGNLGSVVKAILTDTEARQGDNPARAAAGFGRIREPYLQHIGIQRGLGCKRAVRYRDSPWTITAGDQQPLNAYTVFNFYPPNHRAPGSNLLAPEQKTLLSTEFDNRLGRYNWQFGDENTLLSAGCDVTAIKQALAISDDAFIDLLSERLFRGAMSATTRQGLKDSMASRPGWRETPLQVVGAMVQLAAITPGFGAMK